MKVLTHEGAVLTLPFTSIDAPAGHFTRLDGDGGSRHGVVETMDDATVSSLIAAAARREGSFATVRDYTNDVRFIHRALLDVTDGAQIGIETKGSKIRLLIPDDARPRPEPLTEGDRVAFNANASPKEILNAHGTVQSIDGKKATIKLDDGDRRRLTRSTGKEYPPTIPAPLTLLDKIDPEHP